MNKVTYFSLVFVWILFAVTCFVWSAVLSEKRDGLLSVSFLDVGQGDAVFIEAPSGRQVLIDGGPDRGVLRELSRQMPWYDRTIDVVIATHPDTDHVGGLFDVLKRYSVSYIFRPGIAHDAPAAQSLMLEIAKETSAGAKELLARRGQVIDLGDGVKLTILFPDRDVSGVDTNLGSVIARLEHGDTAFLFTGDSPVAIEEYLAVLDDMELKSDVLKIGHHGSKTSSSPIFVGYVSPEYGVISRGCENRYGHPHKEVMDTLERFEIEVLDTCEERTITFVSDGRDVRLR